MSARGWLAILYPPNPDTSATPQIHVRRVLSSTMSEAERPSGEENVLRPRWRQQPPGPPPGPWPFLRALVPMVLIAAGLVWMLSERDHGGKSSPYARIAIINPPRVNFSDALPEAAESGMMDLARGDCKTASAHFRTAHRRNPGQVKIRMLEGASLLCAGELEKAVEVLSELSDEPSAPPQAAWYLAQACLMTGETGCALDALERAAESDPRHREQARRQQRQLMVLLSAE